MRTTLAISAVLLAMAVVLPAADKGLTPERRQELEKQAAALQADGLRQFQRAEYAAARELFREALKTYRAVYNGKDFPQGHANLVASIQLLAVTHWATGENGKAEPLFREALEMSRALYPKKDFPNGHPVLITGIRGLAAVYRDTGDYDKAEALCREALDMNRALYPREQFPNGHVEIARALSALAMLHQAAGEYGKAEALSHQALDMCRALYPREKFPSGHPEIARCTEALANLYQAGGEYAKAEPLFRGLLETYRAVYRKEKFPRGHLDLAKGLNNLANLYGASGEYGKAEPLCREAIDMSRALFPKEQFPRGHTDLAASINNLAHLRQDAGEYGEAETLYQEALDMRRALFPARDYSRGHRDLARSIDNLGCLHLLATKYGKAEPLFREALQMYRTLYPTTEYPQGHPDLAISLNNLAMLHQRAGEYDRARPLCREALEMRRALYPTEKYPQGHPGLAASLNNQACVHQNAGEYEKAETLFKEALTMYRQLLLRYADLAAEAECLNYLKTQPSARDGLLTLSRNRPGGAGVYDVLWDGRAALTRLQERRHHDLMVSRDKETIDLADELRRTRLTLSQFLLSPGNNSAKRRADVEKLTAAKEGLERRIAARLKLAPPRPATAPPTLRDLIDHLPDGSALVDLYRYTDFEQAPDLKGEKGERRTERYVAFVVRPGKDVARVELKDAAPIDAARAAWRKAITAARPDDKAERQAAAAFAKLVWGPLRPALPADLKTVYLAPDGKLSQVPWGALPGTKPDTVLLDECAVCLVPHGPFLLERLEEKPADRAGDSLLAYGGIDYNTPPDATARRDDVRGPLLSEKKWLKWADLPGTAREQEQVVTLARKVLKAEPISRNGRAASPAQLEQDLPRARYAHLATHGFFADPEFRSALQVDPQLFEGLTLDRRGGARSPSVLSGLVLAGANRRGEQAAADGGILTAEGLLGLRLEGLELAVLSACETGLGEEGGGEGVYGLQRSFHVAGCRNVVASLWKVDDGATQALMALFYRNLWEKKLDPAEALRQAQLTLYRHPEAVTVAAKRGVDFSESDLPKVEEKPAEKPKRSPASHWAAFTFSGVRPVEAAGGK